MGDRALTWVVKAWIFGPAVVLAYVLFPFRLIYERMMGRS